MAEPPRDASDPRPDDDDERGVVLREYRRAMYQYSFIGIELGVAIAIGALLGRWLDVRWGTHPWLLLVGVLIGLAAGGKDLLRLVKRAKREGEAKSGSEDPTDPSA